MFNLSEILIKIFIESIFISGAIVYFITKRERFRKTIEEELKKRNVFIDVRFNFKLRHWRRSWRQLKGTN